MHVRNETKRITKKIELGKTEVCLKKHEPALMKTTVHNESFVFIRYTSNLALPFRESSHLNCPLIVHKTRFISLFASCRVSKNAYNA